MAVLDGCETTRRIRRDDARPVHIIALTAHAMDELGRTLEIFISRVITAITSDILPG